MSENRFAHFMLAPAGVWLLLLFAVPMGIVVLVSLGRTDPIFEAVYGWHPGNYADVFDPLFAPVLLRSVTYALATVALCLLIGYPIAYAIARMPPASRNLALMLVILPSWTSFLIRIYAWIGILKNNGLLNNFLLWTGLIDQPLQILHTNVAVYIGIVYAYLPFMVLPLYTNLVKLDMRLLEAAYDLGARPWKVFLAITLPLSRAGIIAGSMLVAIPVVGEFVIPELLGGPSTLMIGKVLWDEFFNNRDWPVASAVSTVMLLLLLLPIMVFHHFEQKEMEQRLT